MVVIYVMKYGDVILADTLDEQLADNDFGWRCRRTIYTSMRF